MFNQNPVISEEVLQRYQTIDAKPMTIQGTLIKKLFCLLL